jgi:predicted secreted hydrolase
MSAGSIDLTVDTSRRPLLEGGSGVVPMGAGGSSYYYSLTNMRTSGTLTLAGRRFAVTGATWMDHQWGNWRWDKIRGWDWMGVQLSNGTSVVLVNFTGARLSNKTAGSSFPDGTQLVTKSSFMTTLNHFWTSPATSVRYPLGWHIQVPAVGLDAQVLPTIPDQEVVDPLSFGPTYWEGSCRVTGTLHGKPITGLAYTELVGYGKPSALGM